MNELDNKKYLEELEHIVDKIIECSKFHRKLDYSISDLTTSIGLTIERIVRTFSHRFDFKMEEDAMLIIILVGSIFSSFYRMYDNNKNLEEYEEKFKEYIDKLFLYCARAFIDYDCLVNRKFPDGRINSDIKEALNVFFEKYEISELMGRAKIN